MLYEGKISYSEGQLTIYNPNDAGVHRCTQDSFVNGFSLIIKGLGLHCFCTNEENNGGTEKSIEHPAKYPMPAKESVLNPFLI